MALYLVEPGLDLSIELPVSEPVERALAIQWERLTDAKVREAFCRRMAKQLDNVIPESIDWDIKEPTKAQVSYAMVLARELGMSVPSQALRYRGSMFEFLEKHSQLLKERREQRSGQ